MLEFFISQAVRTLREERKKILTIALPVTTGVIIFGLLLACFGYQWKQREKAKENTVKLTAQMTVAIKEEVCYSSYFFTRAFISVICLNSPVHINLLQHIYNIILIYRSVKNKIKLIAVHCFIKFSIIAFYFKDTGIKIPPLSLKKH